MELLALLFLSFCFLTLSGLTFGAESGSHVIVKEDDDAILSCSLNNMNIKPMLFDWRKDTERLQVFMYNNGILHNKGPPNQDKQFSGRVSHFPEELEHGNASIIIRKTKVIDSGSYTCEFPHLQPERIFHIELIVGASPLPVVRIFHNGRLQCEVRSASPEPTVEWWDSDNQRLPSEDPVVTEEGDIILKTTVTRTGLYRCVATQDSIKHQIYTETFVQLEELAEKFNIKMLVPRNPTTTNPGESSFSLHPGSTAMLSGALLRSPPTLKVTT
ncbi:butyrophilin subfamily 1 member A1-like isoform X2 [Oreochromis aureus]|uniref:butyrophilin subfamily 1 member A1-like isoform X2 n=1 Tax=Oreochromis aureus TaxID=47969 RepID=UPI001953A20F|nr:butyrophilin subfamily 1 member A1-like isoform X2 [Oreochromis aureus]